MIIYRNFLAIFTKKIMDASIKILLFENEVEALLLGEILTDNKIPHVIRSYHDSAYDGLFQSTAGWGHLEAQEEHKEEILHFYEEMSKKL